MQSLVVLFNSPPVPCFHAQLSPSFFFGSQRKLKEPSPWALEVCGYSTEQNRWTAICYLPLLGARIPHKIYIQQELIRYLYCVPQDIDHIHCHFLLPLLCLPLHPVNAQWCAANAVCVWHRLLVQECWHKQKGDNLEILLLHLCYYCS